MTIYTPIAKFDASTEQFNCAVFHSRTKIVLVNRGLSFKDSDDAIAQAKQDIIDNHLTNYKA